MISDVPGRNIRPSTMLHLRPQRRAPVGVTPRMTTFDGLAVSRFGRLISTTGSFETSGLPSWPMATVGQASRRSPPVGGRRRFALRSARRGG